MVTNTNLVAVELAPLAGATLEGLKIGWINSGAKAAQNDTWTITNAKEVLFFAGSLDATGAAESWTVSTNVIVLTGATGTACSGLVLYR